MRSRALVCALLILTVPAIPGFAVAPARLPVQGFLTDASGVTVNGTVNVTFSLYAAQDIPNALWSEQQALPVDDGVFTAYLGSVNPIDHSVIKDQNDLWLGIAVEGDPEMERVPLGTQPFASYAEHCGNQVVPDSIPSGAVMMFNLAACPQGWSEFAAANGRYLVGMPTGGSLTATVGTELTDQENRPVGQHNHTASSPPHTHTLPLYGSDWDTSPGSAGSDADNSQKSSGPTSVTVNVDPAGEVAGTNAPYVQLLTCVKD